MAVKTGLEMLIENKFRPLLGRKIAVLCNQASITRHFEHILSILSAAQRQHQFKLEAIWGPQHGLWGHTQDNMIEWEGSDAGTIPLYSLYGKHRKPTAEMMRSIDTLVVDLQDVGARYYTFIWTMALCMEAAAESGSEIVILDRPNPLGGTIIEGPVQEPDYCSFVGLYPLPVRHGLTIGEIAVYLKTNFMQNCQLKIIRMEGWRRRQLWPDTRLPWGMPSPNMPTPETAQVYPGMCLLEGTNVSEGRGTTRPFEIFGAPWINGDAFCRNLNSISLPGVHFQSFRFQPTFNKFAGELCQGGFIRVTNPRTFKPFRTGLAVLRECLRSYPEKFRWKPPPYEYEYEKLPIDILIGSRKIRENIASLSTIESIENEWQPDSSEFEKKRTAALLYN